MSRKKVRDNKIYSPLGMRIDNCQKLQGLNASELAGFLGISIPYMSDIKKGRAKGEGYRFWKGIREKLPE